jgi:long-subunit fatty acid transport protein
MNLIRKHHTSLLISLFFFIISNAQVTNNNITSDVKNSFWNNIHLGGGLGLNFNDGYTNLSISPSGIYQINKKLAGGLGLNLNYSSRKNKFDATVLGASFIALYNPIRALQFSLEFEQNNINYNDKIYNTNSNYWSPAFFIGTGYSIGKFGSLGLRYDIIYNNNKSVYGSALLPYIRVYF